ncbi:N-acetyltransferase [Aeromicrobium ginsengisoli]|uniref:N-acetyltransferase n=1 Tax=Aeromicrobium ginsengisoli TaxID=363867 RepID=A0A5M4FHR1_9ACTN|nr:N-acetyltransferase [Aeromicrobium ginsengisoli]KAA1399508.1 N-acetyltransferase [Aeromicrobium ginsengisoli]
MSHPLAGIIKDAAEGRFLPVDGEYHRVTPWKPGLEAVVAFTGHAVFAVDAKTTDETLADLGADGFGGAHDPRLIAELAGPDGWIDSLDVLLVGRGAGPTGHGLVARPDLATHPRVHFAASNRDDVQVFGFEDQQRSTVVVLARGLAGLPEISFELDPEHRGGEGTALIEDALRLVPEGELVVAAAAPGNAASLRALLSAGFVALGSLQLFRRASSDR